MIGGASCVSGTGGSLQIFHVDANIMFGLLDQLAIYGKWLEDQKAVKRSDINGEVSVRVDVD